MSAQWINVRVREKRIAALGVAAFVLEAEDGGALPPFEAGAHVDLALPNGLVRQYSLCGAPGRSACYELGILLEAEGRGGSRSAHADLHEGDRLRISAPRNLFALVPGRHAVLMAGGIGITPILAMAEHLAAAGASFELHYFTRSQDRAAFVERLDGPAFAGRIHYHFDDRPETRLDIPARLSAPAADTHLYVCGPGGFMDHVLDSARAAGWADANVHSERFTAAPADHAADDPFEVEIAGTGTVVPVGAGQSVVAALAAAGISVPVSCEQGICGTCMMQVVEGIPDHRDMYLSDEDHAANDQFTPCCSRALTPRLVIQL